MPKTLPTRYLLPTIIVVGTLVIFVRLGDIWDGVTTGKFGSHAALAETAAKESAKNEKSDKKAEPKAEEKASTKEVAPPAVETPRYSVSDEERSPAEMEVLNQLSQRREELDGRSKDLDGREALLRVAEQRVDQKIKEMTTLRQQLQSMVSQVSESQAAQIENLVKIYETMKPEEAARIFETLDMPVLLGVIQRMKPARTAPIMAKMAPEKAKDITIALTKQDQLPQIK